MPQDPAIWNGAVSAAHGAALGGTANGFSLVFSYFSHLPDCIFPQAVIE
jgi:hypothetical protein